MLLTYRLKKTKEISPPCRHTTAMTWRAGRLPRTPVPEGMRLYGLCRTGSVGALVCRGVHRTIRYRKLWPRRGKRRLLASFRERFRLFSRRGWSTARTCYAWVETQTARLASARDRLLHIRTWLMGSFQIFYQSCPRDYWADWMRGVLDLG